MLLALIKMMNAMIAAIASVSVSAVYFLAQTDLTDVSTWVIGTPVVAASIVILRQYARTVKEVREAAQEQRANYLEEIARKDTEIAMLKEENLELRKVGRSDGSPTAGE